MMSETNPIKKILRFATVDAFESMKESAREQHRIDKANFAAVKAESKANWEEAKRHGKGQAAQRRAAQAQALREAEARQKAAEDHLNAVTKEEV